MRVVRESITAIGLFVFRLIWEECRWLGFDLVRCGFQSGLDLISVA